MDFGLWIFFDNVLLEHGELPCVLPVAVHHPDLGHLPDTHEILVTALRPNSPLSLDLTGTLGLKLGLGLVNNQVLTMLCLSGLQTTGRTTWACGPGPCAGGGQRTRGRSSGTRKIETGNRENVFICGNKSKK